MSKVLIIAEAGVNHNGSLDLAYKLIDTAAEAGADIVKFQTFKAEKLVAKSAPKAQYQIQNLGNDGDNNQFNMLKQLELKEDWHPLLKAYCATKNIQFLSTPFDTDSMEYLVNLGIPFFKLPSGELTNLPYLEKAASYGLPIVLSTGMATLNEIEQAVLVLLKNGLTKDKISLLHCNTEYPTPMEDVNLSAMHTISSTLGIPTGYSDHTKGIEVAIAAVALGAEIIEKHFTLDRNMEGPDHAASLEPNELKQMVAAIRNIEKAIGNGIKAPSPSETKNIPIARKSIHIAKDLPKGHCITAADLTIKRPGNGISPMDYYNIIGKTTAIALNEEHQLRYEDLMP